MDADRTTDDNAANATAHGSSGDGHNGTFNFDTNTTRVVDWDEGVTDFGSVATNYTVLLSSKNLARLRRTLLRAKQV